MTDPDTEHTPRDFGDVGDENDYTAAQRAEREAEQKARCGLRIDGFFADGRVHGVCLRPAGHDGDCHPVPLANDRKEGEDEWVPQPRPTGSL